MGRDDKDLDNNKDTDAGTALRSVDVKAVVRAKFGVSRREKGDCPLAEGDCPLVEGDNCPLVTPPPVPVPGPRPRPVPVLLLVPGGVRSRKLRLGGGL